VIISSVTNGQGKPPDYVAVSRQTLIDKMKEPYSLPCDPNSLEGKAYKFAINTILGRIHQLIS
jgi:hypothetical protein